MIEQRQTFIVTPGFMRSAAVRERVALLNFKHYRPDGVYLQVRIFDCHTQCNWYQSHDGSSCFYDIEYRDQLELMRAFKSGEIRGKYASDLLSKMIWDMFVFRDNKLVDSWYSKFFPHDFAWKCCNDELLKPFATERHRELVAEMERCSSDLQYIRSDLLDLGIQ